MTTLKNHGASDSSACHCGNQQGYGNCCGAFLSGESKPVTAEQLMRSRYSAFCEKNIDYLIATLHPSKRQSDDRLSLSRSMQDTVWLGLRVIDYSSGKSREEGAHESAQVEFAAWFTEDHNENIPSTIPGLTPSTTNSPSQDASVNQLHERSNFLREEGQWYYVDGKMLEPYQPGRNDRCWCGRNKKFKKCHG